MKPGWYVVGSLGLLGVCWFLAPRLGRRLAYFDVRNVEVVGARFIDRGPDRPGTEPGAWAVGRRDVERRTDDGHIGLPGVELGGLGQERPVPE